MKKQEIKEQIENIAEEVLGVSCQEGESLKESGMDSLALATLIVSIEEAFSISFSDDDLRPENITMLSDLVALTEKYL